jgi:hypothetical protein
MHKKMAEKNLVEEAVIQLKNLEEAINENAKEILESTMKQEISELVKESLNEANEDEMDFEDFEEESEEEMGSEDESEEESDEEETEEMDFEDEMSDDEESEEEFEFDDEESPEVMDFTAMDNSPETHDLLMTVFKKMKPEDEVEITKDGDYVNLKDGEEEYLLSVNESEEEEETDDEEFESELEETIYEIAMDDEDETEEESFFDKFDQDNLEDDGETNETIYELHMDDTEMSDEDFKEEEFEYQEEMEEDYQAEEYMNESKKGMKPVVGKGGKTGNAKFSYKKSAGGFKEKMKAANPTKGTGKPKFEYKESTPKMKKGEFKEAARTLGNGSNFRKGGLPKPRAHSKANINMKENYELMEEVQMLRAKNEEYRKALNLFRDKLNEVAVFNSNLAYTTRLFTEHSTSKQEKINILRRFDSAETLKESKNLYKSIKDELSSSNKGNINESFERVIDSEPVTGSAQSLIESKTYENPQFMRMKDLMTKIIK